MYNQMILIIVKIYAINLLRSYFQHLLFQIIVGITHMHLRKTETW